MAQSAPQKLGRRHRAPHPMRIAPKPPESDVEAKVEPVPEIKAEAPPAEMPQPATVSEVSPAVPAAPQRTVAGFDAIEAPLPSTAGRGTRREPRRRLDGSVVRAVAVQLDVELIERLDAVANARGVSRSRLIEHATRELLALGE